MVKKRGLIDINNDGQVVVLSKEEMRKNLKIALKKVDDRLNSLIGPNGGSYRTSGSFKYNENDSNTINITTHGDLSYLLKSLAKMKRIKTEYQAIALEANVKSFPLLTWVGHPIDNWIFDLMLRINVVANASTIALLNQSKKELEGFLSEDDRLAASLRKLQDIL